MTRLIMLTLLACLMLSPPIRSADAEAPGVVFHLDSETSMNRMLAQVARHHSYNPDIGIARAGSFTYPTSIVVSSVDSRPISSGIMLGRP